MVLCGGKKIRDVHTVFLDAGTADAFEDIFPDFWIFKINTLEIKAGIGHSSEDF